MAKAKRLSRRQLAFIEALFANECDEQKTLDDHRISMRLYRKWLQGRAFRTELEYRVNAGYRQSTLLLAVKAREAAKKLAGLAENGKGETARKACMDVITMKPPAHLPGVSALRDDKEQPPPIPPQTASRILAVLAGENDAS
jgi:hypothetical protein